MDFACLLRFRVKGVFQFRFCSTTLPLSFGWSRHPGMCLMFCQTKKKAPKDRSHMAVFFFSSKQSIFAFNSSFLSTRNET
jgi:hypothetical protein